LSVTQWNALGALTMPNPIDRVPLLWLATWVLQIMPLFFFVGGFANYRSWCSNPTASSRPVCGGSSGRSVSSPPYGPPSRC
jgi:hypothetical protein